MKLLNLSNDVKIESFHKYSTEEHIVGKWIDGSDLYEKTISASVAKADDQNIGSLDYTTLISITGFFSSSGSYYPINTTFSNTSYRLVYAKNGAIYISSTGVGNVQLTIRYTK